MFIKRKNSLTELKSIEIKHSYRPAFSMNSLNSKQQIESSNLCLNDQVIMWIDSTDDYHERVVDEWSIIIDEIAACKDQVYCIKF